jgi:hypothetical protein
MDRRFSQARQKKIAFMSSLSPFISLARYIDLTPVLAQVVGYGQPVLARPGGQASAHWQAGGGTAVSQVHQPVVRPQAAKFLKVAFP